MEEIIIRKTDVDFFGRKLLKEVYRFLCNEYILSFEETKLEKDKLEKYLLSYFKMFDESEYENKLKEIKNKIEDESLDIDLIFEVLNIIKLDYEINEDLFVKKKAFLKYF